MLTSEQERDLNRWLDAFKDPISEKASTPATKSGPIRLAEFDA